MTSEDNAPVLLPGKIVKSDDAILVIEKFRRTYRVYTDGKPSNLPTWCTFPKGIQITWDELYKTLNEIPTNGTVYFYQEGGNSEKYILRHTSNTEIETFFRTRQPWQDKDYYIFDDSFRYCIAVTHDDDIISVAQI